MYIINLDVLLRQKQSAATNPVTLCSFCGSEHKIVPVHTLKAYGEIKAYLHVFLILRLSGRNLSAWRPFSFNSGNSNLGTQLGGSYSRCGSFGKQKNLVHRTERTDARLGEKLLLTLSLMWRLALIRTECSGVPVWITWCHLSGDIQNNFCSVRCAPMCSYSSSGLSVNQTTTSQAVRRVA